MDRHHFRERQTPLRDRKRDERRTKTSLLLTGPPAEAHRDGRRLESRDAETGLRV